MTLNSDELDSEDLDRLEKGKGLKNKVLVSKNQTEDIGKAILEKKGKERAEKQMSAFDRYQEKKRERRRVKKMKEKEQKAES